MGSGALVWGYHPQHHPRSPHGQHLSTSGLRQQCGCRGGVQWQSRQVLSGTARAWHDATAQRASQPAQTSSSADCSHQNATDQSGGQRSQASADDGSAAAVRLGSNGSVVQHPGDGHGAAQTAAASRVAASDVPKLEMLSQQDFGRFVSFFRGASPYIEGHRGRTFVVVIPGEVVGNKTLLYPLLEDIALLHGAALTQSCGDFWAHGLGVRLVLVLGVRPGIDDMVRDSGHELTYSRGQRVTDGVAMEAAMQAAGAARMEVEARLSKGPALTMVRRHTRGLDRLHYGPALQTVSGNYVAAKRKGVVDGVDYGFTGAVRFVQVASIARQLDAGAVVLLSNLGFSAAGEVLNCDIYQVATRAAIDMAADKLICMTVPETQPIALPLWTPLADAERVLFSLIADRIPDVEPGSAAAARDAKPVPTLNSSGNSGSGGSSSNGASPNEVVSEEDELDFDRWQAYRLPLPLLAACAACEGGVNRTHLVDATTDGALLLELYSRDGIGAMISADFYEGIRDAHAADADGVAALLAPLEAKGILKPRSREALLEELPWYTVVEREGKLLACAMLRPLGQGPDSVSCAELAAFCVHSAYRGSGRGDSLLDFLERKASRTGIERVVLLTTRTADWFEQRGFKPDGPAHESLLLPESRRKQIDASRGSLIYAKEIKRYDSDAMTT